MDIVLKAKEFAIEAYKEKFKKSNNGEPMIIHSIDVANILSFYGFDNDVIAAGIIQDVVKNTKYNLEDIELRFGDEIKSLIIGAIELNKSLLLEERKYEYLNKFKYFNIRHKAVVCADEISNLEKLIIISGINGKYEFEDLKKEFDLKKWYYSSIYETLIFNEDENNEIFLKLKQLIDEIFYGNKTDFVKDNFFENKEDEYNKLKNFHYRKHEIYKLNNVITNKRPYVIEFTGTPRTGKTGLINNLYDFFKKCGFRVEVIEEFTTSKKYKNEIYPQLKDKYKYIVNAEIPKYIFKQLENSINNNPDIIIIDRSLFDRLIWVDRLYKKNGMEQKEYEKYKKYYIPFIKDKIDIIIATFTDSLTAIKRDYDANLSLEKRYFLNKSNVNEYNNSLFNMVELSKNENIKIYVFDTTNKNQRTISFEIVDIILKNIKNEYMEQIYKEYNGFKCKRLNRTTKKKC